MTKLASRSLGTAVPTSAHADWMERAIRRVESKRVPAQSKTIRSKRRVSMARDSRAPSAPPPTGPAPGRRSEFERRDLRPFEAQVRHQAALDQHIADHRLLRHRRAVDR